MKNLYYATYERGLGSLVEKFIKKQDKNSYVKKLYEDAILFFGNENFKGKALPFKTIYEVLDRNFKTGAGALNSELKHFLERKDLKIFMPKNVESFKLVFKSEIEKLPVDDGLKKAVEITLKKMTKRQISFVAEQAEFQFLAKKDGENLFMKKIFMSKEFTKFAGGNGISLDLSYFLCFLSEPAQSEVVLDAFAGNGIISFVRALCFKKANVIASEENESLVKELKMKSKTLKEKNFAVLKYSFLSEKFPIHFIDKVVTSIPVNFTDEELKLFFDKLHENNVKIVSLICERTTYIDEFIENKFEIECAYETMRYKLLKLKRIK